MHCRDCRGCPRPGSSPQSAPPQRILRCWVATRVAGAKRGGARACLARNKCQSQNGASSPTLGQGWEQTEGCRELRADEWHPLREPLVWQGTEDDILSRQSTALDDLPPALKLMLLSDGSVTQHLQLLLNQEVLVDSVEEVVSGHRSDGLPDSVQCICEPLVQRQALLKVPSKLPLVYASSWWNDQTLCGGLFDTRKPVGMSLKARKLETYREIESVFKGDSSELEDLFGAPGPFWGRQYLLWHKEKPLTCIYEVFSTSLQVYLSSVRQQNSQNGSRSANGTTKRDVVQ